MPKILVFLMAMMPVYCFSQLTISGRVINHADIRPVANASVFLSNATIGDKTADDGTFNLKNVQAGKYELVVSIIGFETYKQTIVVANGNIDLSDITIVAKTIVLNEVKIKFHADANREAYYNLFKDEFLGKSDLARQCKIINPDIIDFTYNDTTRTLTASTPDFLEIENPALGYKIKYLLSDFTLINKNPEAKNIYYKGSVLFEPEHGAASEEKRWQKNRQEVYENSPMHFLRSAVTNQLEQEGFKVQQVAVSAGISEQVTKSKVQNQKKLLDFPLKETEIVKLTDQKGLFALGCENDGLYVTYNKDHHNHQYNLNYLNNENNTESSLVNFNEPYAFFYSNGIIANSYAVLFTGVWGNNRVAELLPLDFEPLQDNDINNDNAVSIVAKIDNFSTQHVTEKAYLHFDKPYYAAGDTMYFKAYLTLGEEHRPSDLSGVLHVDLINAANKIDQSIKLKVTNGTAWGDFALPDSLPGGNYRVRAYTRWMRNDGNYFEQTFTVGSILSTKIPESGVRNQSINTKADIQFFPEGGELIAGVKSKVAFKAIGTNGSGIDVKGIIVDNENNVVANFASTHLGMGCFYLNPQYGKAYKAKLFNADGTENLVSLPVVRSDGLVMSVNNDSVPKASVRIEMNKACYQLNRDKDYTIVVYSGGAASAITRKMDSTVINVDILKRHLQTGVAVVTLFSPSGEPLSERLIFVQNYNWLNIDLSSGKATYAQREKVNIRLNVKNRADEPATGHFSVSVVDENKVPVDANSESTIFNYLLLTSDLKGYIEQPNYYFINETDKTRADLDLVMLTHGYRRFEWKPLLTDTYHPESYQPEKGLEISGTAKSVFGKALVNGTVSLISKHDGTFISTTTDDQGHFKFDNLDFTDTAKFVLQAVNTKGENDTKLVYSKDVAEPDVVPVIYVLRNDSSLRLLPYIENAWKQQNEEAKYGAIKGQMLKTVIIKDKKIENIPISANRRVSPGFADQVIKPEDMAKGGLFSDRIQGALHGINIMRGNGGIGAYAILPGGSILSHMLVILDGVKTDGDLDEISGVEIEDIEVLKYASKTAYGSDGTNGVLVINTTRHLGLQSKDISSMGILPIYPKGFYKAREFYSPKYDSLSSNTNRADMRSTIYWQPELTTDKNGNASFEYYNADGDGKYRVVIEGIDDAGNLGRQVFEYKVE